MDCIVVSGGCGFIGSHFIRQQLARHPEQLVINIDKLTYAGNPENVADLESHRNYRFERGDIGDRDFVRATLAGHDVQAIVNLAAETHVDRSIAGSDAFFQSNLIGAKVLADAALESGTGRFLQVSTDEVYGSVEPPRRVDETGPLLPGNPYAASKAAADLMCRSYYGTHGLPVIITRSCNVFGSCQHPEKLIPQVVSRASRDRPVLLYGDGGNFRDWLHVADQCEALDAALRRGRVGQVYNIGGAHEARNIDLVGTILDIMGKPASLIEFVADRPGHDSRYALDSARAREQLGWERKCDFAASLRETVKWYLEHPGWIERSLARSDASAIR